MLAVKPGIDEDSLQENQLKTVVSKLVEFSKEKGIEDHCLQSGAAYEKGLCDRAV